MIRITRDYTAIPAGLLSDTARKWIDKALSEKENHSVYDYVYRHPSVVDSLNRICSGKCVYCESRLWVSSSLCVDHYRPKKGVKGKDGHPGYYWLAYEWSNLLSICGLCNNKKSNLFPVEDEANRICQPQEDRSQWRADSESFLSENPLILHPELDNPEEYIRIDVNGAITEKNSSLRGKTTIEVCGLNRDGLIWVRNRIITKTRKRLWHIAFMITQEVRDGRISRKDEFLRTIRERFADDFDLLVLRTNPEEEYSFVGKSMLQEFKSFFIDTLSDEGTRNILNKAFALFSEQIAEEMNNAPR